MGRNRPLPAFDDWYVVTNVIGQMMLVDKNGHELTKHPDRVIRIRALYLAAQAPALEMLTRELVRVVEYITQGSSHTYRPLVEATHLTLSMIRPPHDRLAQLELVRHQGELDLEAA